MSISTRQHSLHRNILTHSSRRSKVRKAKCHKTVEGNFIRSPLLLDDVIALSSEDSHQGALQSACEPILSEECPLGSEVQCPSVTDPVP